MENDQKVDKPVSETRHKFIIVGDLAVGKTSIISRLIDNPFNEAYRTSIGLDNCSKTLIHQNKKIKLQIWDTAGQEKFRSLITSYVRNASVVIIVYDISNRDSYLHLEDWVNYIKSIEKTNIVICGNKSDLEGNRKVSKEEGEKFAKENNFLFFEVSAKDNDNIKRLLYRSVAEMHIFDDVEDKSSLAEQLEIENYNLKVTDTEGDVNMSMREGTNVTPGTNPIQKGRKCAC